MEFTTREKINALMSYIEDIDEIRERISNINILINIFTVNETFEITSKLYGVREDVISVIERINKNEMVEK